MEGIDTKSVAIDLPFVVERAEEIDFLELKVLGRLAADGGRITFDIGHNEIKAIRVFRKGEIRP